MMLLKINLNLVYWNNKKNQRKKNLLEKIKKYTRRICLKKIL